MADKKISELTELTTPDGTEELVVNDSGVSKKVQIDNLLAGGTISNFTSTGIDDNATSTAITIDNEGSLTLAATAASIYINNNEASGDVQLNKASHATSVSTLYNSRSVRVASNTFHYFVASSNNGGDNEHRLAGDGNAYCDGSFTGGGADYAEYFEWSDGNTANEDRRGYSVVLDGAKIRQALAGETPMGVISGNPSVVGDSAWNKWNGKYLADDFGTYILEEYTVTAWEAEEANEDGELSIVTKSFESDKIPAEETVPSDAVVSTTDDNGNLLERRTLSPDWNPDTDYVSREDRKEWDTVGLMGKLRVLKGQPVDSRWIKMRDVSDTVEEWLVR